MTLEVRLLLGIEKIAGRPVTMNENLIGGAVDSLALVELVNLVEDLGKELNKRINMDNLISEESLTAARILAELS